jgi:TPP-dependent pyruvate/acetoin dehydrogenase alpha subunit
MNAKLAKPPDLLRLYEQMLRSRLFEEAVRTLWEGGLISGEMHPSLGEEGIAAGVVCQLEDGDAMALDHRGTAPLVMRGVSLASLLDEFLGKPEGLCGGKGGHMHLFSAPHLAASSGIVGASGPAAAGFALAAQYLRPGKVALAFFGEGAMNQGMLLESFNLSAAWKLPVIFICKDNQWAITTLSPTVTGGILTERARGFGIPAAAVDGSNVEKVWGAAQEALLRAREGDGPTFLHASCMHLEGHFLGYQLFRLARAPLREMAPMAGLMTRALLSRNGAPLSERLRSVRTLRRRIQGASKEAHAGVCDPLLNAREKLAFETARLEQIEARVQEEITAVVNLAMGGRDA